MRLLQLLHLDMRFSKKRQLKKSHLAVMDKKHFDLHDQIICIVVDRFNFLDKEKIIDKYMFILELITLFSS